MTPYKHTRRNTGIKAYEIIETGIIIQFQDERIYKFTCESTGRLPIEIMKGHAKKGVGLTTYINQYFREKYAEKIS